jgi:hypothetical protein
MTRRARWLGASLLAVGAAALALWAGGAGAGRGTGAQTVSELLSGIDFIPSRPTLDDAMGAAAPDELIAIARGRDANLDDPGLRIRAYRALGLYPGPETEAALAAAVHEHSTKVAGTEILYLRAAMGALARVAGERAVDVIGPMLGHPSRDVRADAARALRETGSNRAACYIRPLQASEEFEMVQVAMEEAIREVGDCPPLVPGPGRRNP